jgi:dihydroorotase
MLDLLIKNAIIVNEGISCKKTLGIKESRFCMDSEELEAGNATETIDAKGLYLFPGIIDDQVHFRDPGLTHKGDIFTESRAAAAGGITSYMEMPNTNPQTITQEALQNKFVHAARNSLVNYSFYIGATNNNLDELLKTDPKQVCGVKIFMGSSTGNMLVDDPESLNNIFSAIRIPIAVHCEDEQTIIKNSKYYRNKFGENIPISYHPAIRSAEACYKSSSMAVELAAKYGTRLHILHISTGKELDLFEASGNPGEKKITAEVCIHHLWFNDGDYEKYGSYIKWNPAIKSARDQEALLKGLHENKIDVVATDHAPHTMEEKEGTYFYAPSGGPLVQHSLVAMLELYHQKKISLEKIIEKMCHNPALVFNIKDRGYIRDGYWADFVLVDLNNAWTVEKSNLLYKCKWSPFENQDFHSKVVSTYVNGHRVFHHGRTNEIPAAMRLEFIRPES